MGVSGRGDSHVAVCAVEASGSFVWQQLADTLSKTGLQCWADAFVPFEEALADRG